MSNLKLYLPGIFLFPIIIINNYNISYCYIRGITSNVAGVIERMESSSAHCTFLLEKLENTIFKCGGVIPSNFSCYLMMATATISVLLQTMVIFNCFYLPVEALPVVDISPYVSTAEFNHNLNWALGFCSENLPDFSNNLSDRFYKINFWKSKIVKEWKDLGYSLKEMQALTSALDLAYAKTHSLSISGERLLSYSRFPKYYSFSGEDLSTFIDAVKYYNKITILLDDLKNYGSSISEIKVL